MEISITGAKIYYVIPIFGGIPITETIVNAWIVMALITGLSIWLTKGIVPKSQKKRHLVAEIIVGKATGWVIGNMGEAYAKSQFPPFIAAIFSLSMFCSLVGLIGMYPPTADLSTTSGWAVMVFIMILYNKIKVNKVSGYLKGLTKPIIVLTPINVIGELSTPFSMAVRHFGNIASGQVVSTLVYAALSVLNSALFGWITGVVGEFLTKFPVMQIGAPAVLSIYFDVFSSAMQAFIFATLTMNYIAAAAQKD
jgi:F-type H+-transporting ATPase subunit a